MKYINISLEQLKNIQKFLLDKLFKKVFIITGRNSYFKSNANLLFENILKNKNTFFFFKKSFYPEINELKNLFRRVKMFNPDLIIGIGGGSVLDYAKIVSILKTEDRIENLIKNAKLMAKKKIKVLAIPTTAGSGAEVTSNAVVYINKKKYSIENKYIKPDYFFLIPELLISNPKNIKASSGFDAIAQSLESIISMKSNQRSLNYAVKSLEISFRYFLDYVNKPNLDNCFKMALASNLSGEAINISKTTAPHALSYPFTSYFNVSHGHAVSLTINNFFKFNYLNQKYSVSEFNLKKRFDTIFKLAKVKNIYEFEKFINNLQKKAGLETNYKKLGIDIEKNYNKIISGVNLQRLKNNPIPLDIKDLKRIITN